MTGHNQIEARRLRETLRQLARRLDISNQNEASCCGLGLTHCHALVEVGRRGEMSVNELADLLGLDKSTISRTVNTLVEQTLFKREPDPQDRRFVSLCLSSRGEEALRLIETTMEDYYLQVYDAIPAEKRDQVLESLDILLRVLPVQCC
ncbi:MAG: MarR family winged helix-turn-helix transcriptional regulator [Methylocystaceae bacterium]